MASQLQSWIQRVIVGTQDGSIKWTPQNPTVFLWESPNPPGKVFLQRTDQSEQVAEGGRQSVRKYSVYFLSVINPANLQNVVTVRGDADPDANKQLETLYEAIQARIERETLDFLNAILPPDKKD
jgi:hypothetical protein